MPPDEEPILRATFELLCERGFAGLSMDAVSVRSGVHPSQLFSRWRSRSDLLVALLRHYADEAPELPDSGDLRSDLVVVLDRIVEAVHRLRVLVAVVGGEAARDPELARELRLFIFSWQTMARQLIARAIERQELPDNLNHEWAADLLASIVWFRIELVGDHARLGLAERLADPILKSWGHR